MTPRWLMRVRAWRASKEYPTARRQPEPDGWDPKNPMQSIAAQRPRPGPIAVRPPLIRSLPTMQYIGPRSADQWAVFLRSGEWATTLSGDLIVETARGEVRPNPGDWLLRDRSGLHVLRPVSQDPGSPQPGEPEVDLLESETMMFGEGRPRRPLEGP